MTIGELITQLSGYDPTRKIYISSQTGNYWHDIVAHDVQWTCLEKVKYSDYNRAFKIVDYDEDGEDIQEIVVIS